MAPPDRLGVCGPPARRGQGLAAARYDALTAAITELGDDVTAEGRGTYIPFVRGRQFAAIAAAARDRVDLGLRFSDPPASAPLRPGGGPGPARHTVSLRAVQDVDDEIRHLLRTAYEQNSLSQHCGDSRWPGGCANIDAAPRNRLRPGLGGRSGRDLRTRWTR
jgi:predicted transport protein